MNWRDSMTNQEFLAELERLSPIDDPEEEQKLLDESFKEGFDAFLAGDDEYEEWEEAQNEED
jgi:hypothetical protein